MCTVILCQTNTSHITRIWNSSFWGGWTYSSSFVGDIPLAASSWNRLNHVRNLKVRWFLLAYKTLEITLVSNDCMYLMQSALHRYDIVFWKKTNFSWNKVWENHRVILNEHHQETCTGVYSPNLSLRFVSSSFWDRFCGRHCFKFLWGSKISQDLSQWRNLRKHSGAYVVPRLLSIG